MAYRREGFETGGVYHLLNRGVEKRNIFLEDQDYDQFLRMVNFYRKATALPFSQISRGIQAPDGLSKQLATVLCFCLMPNHFHLLVRQTEDHGISHFMRRALNSYTRWFNAKYERSGPLLAGQFRAVRVQTDEQLLHVSRYIHLNPYVSHVTDTPHHYRWSSLLAYVSKDQHNILPVSDALIQNMMAPTHYANFVSDHGDYARELAKMKHLVLEDEESVLSSTSSRSYNFRS